jgi:hypothetical protein
MRWLKVIKPYHSVSDKEKEIVKVESRDLEPDKKALVNDEDRFNIKHKIQHFTQALN